VVRGASHGVDRHARLSRHSRASVRRGRRTRVDRRSLGDASPDQCLKTPSVLVRPATTSRGACAEAERVAELEFNIDNRIKPGLWPYTT